MKQPRSRWDCRQQLVDAGFTDAGHPEAGEVRGKRSRLANTIDRQSTQPVYAGAAVTKRIGAGEQDCVKFRGIRCGSFDRLDREQRD